MRAWDWEMPDRIKAKAWAAYITAIETDETWGGLTEFRAACRVWDVYSVHLLPRQ